MTHLGSLGKHKPLEPVTFDYFGTEIAATPGLSDLHYLDFMESVAGLGPDDPQSLSFVKNYARACIADLDTFWRLALENRQSQEDVFETLSKVVEAATARPTESPSGSSDGRRDTEANSTAGSSSLDKRLEGRPDLQLIVAEAKAARAS